MPEPWIDIERLVAEVDNVKLEPFQKAIVDRWFSNVPEEVRITGDRRSGKTTRAVALLLADPDSVLMTFSAGERARIIREFKLGGKDARRVVCCDNELRGVRPTQVIYDDVKPMREQRADQNRMAATTRGLRKAGMAIKDLASVADDFGRALNVWTDAMTKPVEGDPSDPAALKVICDWFGYYPHEVVGWCSYRDFSMQGTCYEVDLGNGVPMEHFLTDEELEAQ
jgi:hypothetical protein